MIWPRAKCYRNAWFVGDDNLPDNVLQVAKNYTLISNISAFSYEALRSNLIKMGMSVVGDLPIADVLAGSAKTARFTIKPIVSASWAW